MPHDAPSRVTVGETPHLASDSSDLVGDELGDGARIWLQYDRVARDEDRERIGTWNRGLDNLALFAGLFSAVTTAFIIELRHDANPDYAFLTFLVLNASATGVPFRREPFIIDPSIRMINCLWIASLMLSLSAALIAIMGKDWIGMYASRPVCNPRQWAEIRTYRLACVERWYMSGVIASAPVLLHLSLVLFTVGLVRFVPADPLSQNVALSLVVAAGGLYLIVVLSAIIFQTSPFKSPATQAVRRFSLSILASLCNRPAYPPKRRLGEMLQQANVIIRMAFSRLLRSGIATPFSAERCRTQHRDARMRRDCLVPDALGNSYIQGRPWRYEARRCAKRSWARFIALVHSVKSRLLSALDAYYYRRQRPRTRAWHASVLLYLRRIDLSDHWTEVSAEANPELLAQSLSQLNSMTHSTEVFHAILVAIGDICIGRTVAPLLSHDLKSRLATDLRHNWPKADLGTLSRYILADQHLSRTPLIPSSVISRFKSQDTTPSLRSESIVFALTELSTITSVHCGIIDRYCPDITIQPRAVPNLLPLLCRETDVDLIIVLARRYWRHLSNDPTFNLEAELRQRMGAQLAETYNPSSTSEYRDPCGLMGLLVSRISVNPTERIVLRAACGIILQIIEAESGSVEHPCLVYAFGSDDGWITYIMWEALPQQHTCFELALPLQRRGSYRRGTGPTNPIFGVCLARTIVRLLSPSRILIERLRPSGDDSWPYVFTLDLCVQQLHTQLCSSRSGLDGPQKLDVIEGLLRNAVLFRCYWNREHSLYPPPTTDRNVINIVTIVARQIRICLESPHSFATGASLLPEFSFCQIIDYGGVACVWDAGSYVREMTERAVYQGPDVEVSLQRLIRALRALRPPCVMHTDLREAWNRMELPSDDAYSDPFWDAGDFDLGECDIPEACAATEDRPSEPAGTQD